MSIQNSVFKALRDIAIRQFIKKGVETYAFLGIGPVGWVFSFFVNLIGDKLLRIYHKVALDSAVAKEVDTQVEGVKEALEDLVLFEENKGKYTVEEQDALDEKIIASSKLLIKY